MFIILRLFKKLLIEHSGSKEKNNAFQRLYNLQLLLKKESALKELCKI